MLKKMPGIKANSSDSTRPRAASPQRPSATLPAATSANRHQATATRVCPPKTAQKVLQSKMLANPRPINQVRRAPVAPPAYRPQPTPVVLQRKTALNQQSPESQKPHRPVAPPVYRPAPGKVMQPKGKLLGQGLLATPPVYRPQPVPKVLQPKRAAAQLAAKINFGRTGHTIQLSKQEKIKAAVAGKKRAKERKAAVTARNIGGYSSTDASAAAAFVASGGVVKGHHSGSTMNKMNSATKKGLEEFEAFKKKHQQSASSSEVDDAYVSSEEGSSSEEEGVALEELETLAKNVWDTAVNGGKDGLTAMQAYLNGRAEHDPYVTKEMAATILTLWGDFPSDQTLPAGSLL